jgi:hypothetical protein
LGWLFCVVLFIAAPALVDPVRLRVAWVDTPSQLTPLRAVLAEQHPEIFPHLGKTYSFEPVHFAGSLMRSDFKAVQEDIDMALDLKLLRRRWRSRPTTPICR